MRSTARQVCLGHAKSAWCGPRVRTTWDTSARDGLHRAIRPTILVAKPDRDATAHSPVTQDEQGVARAGPEPVVAAAPQRCGWTTARLRRTPADKGKRTPTRRPSARKSDRAQDTGAR